jgi:3-oxoacyl-[acyl-carrier protein] reductase
VFIPGIGEAWWPNEQQIVSQFRPSAAGITGIFFEKFLLFRNRPLNAIPALSKLTSIFPFVLDKIDELHKHFLQWCVHMTVTAGSLTPFASLAGARALVTGASTGIGRAIALTLAAGGANVIVHCRQSVDAAKQVATECQAIGVRAETLSADLSQPAETGALAEQAWRLWDGLDILVNNAGVDLLTGPAAQLEFDAKLQQLLDVDVRATAQLGRDIGTRMKTAGGTILNIGWDQADRGMEGDSGELFATAKNAIMGFTRSLAVSLAPSVRVNCIAPGWIRTAWGEQASEAWQQRVIRETPLRRWGTPEDIAACARFLVSPAAAFITGQVIAVNGGAVR